MMDQPSPNDIRPIKMLNVGCGEYFDSRWTNIDLYSSSPHVIAHDITKGLPFENSSFDVVYHSHILEHLDRTNAILLLRECYRILKPKGILRVVVPDLEFSARLYLQALHEVTNDDQSRSREHYEWSVLNLMDQMVRTHSGGEMLEFLARKDLTEIDFFIENAGGTVIRDLRQTLLSHNAINDMPRLSSRTRIALNVRKFRHIPWNVFRGIRRKLAPEEADFRQAGELHQWMYDHYSLKHLLSSVGFGTTHIITPFESEIPNWQIYHLDVKADGSIHKPHSLFAEAIKEV